MRKPEADLLSGEVLTLIQKIECGHRRGVCDFQGPADHGLQFDFAANLDKDDIYKFPDGTTMLPWDAPPSVISH
ncbi:MAG: hypothetical protein ABSD59_17085 [Terracidiphilus sp.]